MIVSPGTTSFTGYRIQLVDDTGLPLTGKVAASFPSLYYTTGTNTAALNIPLTDLTAITSNFSSGGIKEDTGSMGFYRLDVPNAAFANARALVRIYAEASGYHVLAPAIQVSLNVDSIGGFIQDYQSQQGLYSVGTDYFNHDAIFCNVIGIITSTLTETTLGNLAASFKKMLDVSSPVFTAQSVNQTGDNFARIGANGANLTVLATASALSTVSTAISNLNNLSALAVIYGPTQMEVPASGSIAYPLTMLVKDAEGHLLDLSASPTITAANAAGTSRSGNLSAVTHASTGQYTFTYTVASTAAQEGVSITGTGTASSDSTSRIAILSTAIVSVDTTATLAAIKAKTDNLPASPAAVGSQMTLSNTTVSGIQSGLATAANITASQAAIIAHGDADWANATVQQQILASSVHVSASDLYLPTVPDGWTHSDVLIRFAAGSPHESDGYVHTRWVFGLFDPAYWLGLPEGPWLPGFVLKYATPGTDWGTTDSGMLAAQTGYGSKVLFFDDNNYIGYGRQWYYVYSSDVSQDPMGSNPFLGMVNTGELGGSAGALIDATGTVPNSWKFSLLSSTTALGVATGNGLAADIAAVKSDTAAIKINTDLLATGWTVVAGDIVFTAGALVNAPSGGGGSGGFTGAKQCSLNFLDADGNGVSNVVFTIGNTGTAATDGNGLRTLGLNPGSYAYLAGPVNGIFWSGSFVVSTAATQSFDFNGSAVATPTITAGQCIGVLMLVDSTGASGGGTITFIGVSPPADGLGIGYCSAPNVVSVDSSGLVQQAFPSGCAVYKWYRGNNKGDAVTFKTAAASLGSFEIPSGIGAP
jgi:hypothetical protein